jgi:hypothetical protein
MKRYLLHRLGLMALLMIVALGALAQTTVKLNGDSLLDLAKGPLNTPAHLSPITEIVAPTPRPDIITSLSSNDPTGKCTVWLEFSDGGFSTQFDVARQSRTNSQATVTPFLMMAPLYDTFKGKDFTIARYMNSLQPVTLPANTTNRLQSNDGPPLLMQDEYIKLTPSNYSIVPGEPLALAITYSLPELKDRKFDIGMQANSPSYYAVLYYNSNKKVAFQPISGTSTTVLRYNDSNGSITAKDVRYYNGEQVLRNVTGLPAAPTGYSNSLIVKLYPTLNIERNFFVTLKALGGREGLLLGDSSSITVKLFAVVNNKLEADLGTASLSDMHTSLAFDPNEISQTPHCLILPKANTPLKYRISFQNLGKGPADTIRVIFHRPLGLTGENLIQQVKVKYAGRNVTLSDNPDFFYHHGYNSTTNRDTFIIAPKPTDIDMMLVGTEQVGTKGLTIYNTMGEINFTMNTNTGVADSLISHAEIEFRSRYGTWEKPVRTNTEKTVYRKKACECDDTCNSCCIFLGLCWWWWVLILMGLLLLIWLLRRRRRS